MVPTARNGVRPSVSVAWDRQRAAQLQQRVVEQERQNQHGGQMLVLVPEVVFQLVDLVLQRVKGLVLDLLAAACTGVRLGRDGPAVFIVEEFRYIFRMNSLQTIQNRNFINRYF